jgi:hypothetical protein
MSGVGAGTGVAVGTSVGIGVAFAVAAAGGTGANGLAVGGADWVQAVMANSPNTIQELKTTASILVTLLHVKRRVTP